MGRKETINQLRADYRAKWQEIPTERLAELQERAAKMSLELQQEGLTFAEMTMVIIDLLGQAMMNIRETMAQAKMPGAPSDDDLCIAWIAEMGSVAQRLVQNEIEAREAN